MYYEINVSKRQPNGGYKHYFATAKRSITSESELTTILKDFDVKFPQPEFHLSATYHSEGGAILDINKYLNQ